MIRFVRATLDPDRYHGSGGGRPYFEGWYFKLVDPTYRHRYAIIPGVFRGEDPVSDHAFIQVLDGLTGRVAYNPYSVEEFSSSEERFDIWIGPNNFTAGQISLNVARPDCTVQGRLGFRDLVRWPASVLSPGIMGWYAWVPFMECYHGVVSLDHTIEGEMTLFEQSIDFTGGRGYTEKDWGRSFPAAWVWCQTNHFDHTGTSLTGSVAIIPWLRGSFAGFIVGFWHGRRLYRFATYTGARIEELAIGDRDIHWIIRDRHHELEILLSRPTGGLLHAPTTISMDRRIAETLDATAQVRLSAVGGPSVQTIFDGVGRYAGLEAAGDLERLQQLHRAGKGRRPFPGS